MSEKNSLILFTQASKMLAEADTIAKVKEFKDLALTAKDWAERKKMGQEAIQYANSYAVRAEIKIGEMLKETERAKPAVGSKVIGNIRLPMKDTKNPTLKEIGISKNESSKAQKLAELPKEEQEKVIAGETTASKAIKVNKQKEAIKKLNEASKEISKDKQQQLDSVCRIEHCSMEELFNKNYHIDVVITDPPYPKEYLHLYEELAKITSKIKTIRTVAVMCGQSYLPEIYAMMSKYLTYRWTGCYLTLGGACKVWPRKVDTAWKPILIFGEDDKCFNDIFKSDAEDKDFHTWGQSISGMNKIIKALSKPNDWICDPFIGGGATAVSSLLNARRFIGCDINKESVETTIKRCRTLEV